MKFFEFFPANFSDLIDRTLKITQNGCRSGRSLRQCAQFRSFHFPAGKTCAHGGQMCGPSGREKRPAARWGGFLQEAEEKAAEKGSPPRGAGSAQPRLRGCHPFSVHLRRRDFKAPLCKGSWRRRRLRDCCRRFATAGCLRRPYLFPCAGKDRGEKGAWMRLVHSASEFRQLPMFQASFHSVVTLCMSWYAPPDTGVSDL